VGINTLGAHYDKVLQVASHRGNYQLIKVRLENQTDVNQQGGYYGNPLQAAAAGGHERVVKLLLDNGAESI
jgi:ankyrin repeat protein